MKTIKFKSNCLVRRIPLAVRLLILAVCACFGLASTASAQTLITGPTTSGTWSPSGNPYIVSGNVPVPDGQTLTIQPGVLVEIGSGLTITTDGSIQAVGTPSQHITFQAPTSSQYWNQINPYTYDPSMTNRFKYCDFQNASTALYFSSPNPGVNNIEIMNCTFSNCLTQAVEVDIGGGVTYVPIIKNCIFSGTSNGCVMYLDGAACGCSGNAYATIIGNIFQNLTGSALNLTIYIPDSSTVSFVNNTLNNCKVGVSATDPWDAQIQDNIFVGCTNAVKVSGSLSQLVSYNDFYGNATNFTGYSGIYGQVFINNRNGTPCDLLFNIYQNPLFTAVNDFHLTTSSSCVNAGTPDPEFANMCLPPSIATNFPDLGAYGGPDACNWLTTVPLLPAQLSLAKSNSFVWLSFGAIPRSTYQVQFIATNLDAASGTNRWLTNTTLIPAAKPVSIAVSPYPTTNSKAFYRVRSLGRTPGN